MDAKHRSDFSVPFVARYGLYFGQGNVNRSGIGKLIGRVLKENACTHLSLNENRLAGVGLAVLDHE